MTASATNASQITQFKTVAIVDQGSASPDASTTLVGMTSRAATVPRLEAMRHPFAARVHSWDNSGSVDFLPARSLMRGRAFRGRGGVSVAGADHRLAAVGVYAESCQDALCDRRVPQLLERSP